MNPEHYNYLLNANVFSAFLPLIILIVTKNRARYRLRRVLYFLSITWLVAEGGASLLARNGLYNIWLFHFYDTFSTIGYLIFFHLTIPNIISKRVLYLFGGTFVVFIWVNVWVRDSFFMPVTINTIVTFSIPLLLSVYSFYHIAKESKVINLFQDPVYWINCAILIHFGVGLCANFALEYIVENRNLNMTPIVWPFVLVSNIIHNIVLSIGIWKTKRT